MEVFLLSVVGAFLLFSVILPLCGVVIGLFFYYVMPYVFGGVISLGLLFFTGAKVLFALWAWVLTMAWVSAVVFAKIKFRKLGAEIEHYRAAHAVLLCGAPYRRKRDELQQNFALEGEL